MSLFSFEKSLKWAILTAGSDCLIGGEKVKTGSPYTLHKERIRGNRHKLQGKF